MALMALGCSGALAQDVHGNGDEQKAVWLIVLPVLLLAGGAFQAVVAVLFPRWTEATRAAVSTRRGLCLGWGAAIAVLASIVLVAGSAVQGVVAFLAGVIALLVLLLSVAGYVGLAAAMGECVLPDSGPAGDRTPLQTLVGGVVLCFACLTPILGQILWLLLLPASLGAAVVALCRRPDLPEEPT
jgi:hypothetical protein